MFNNIYADKTILVTGHTGFKGAWLSLWLTRMGAKVIGLALEPNSKRGMYSACHLRDTLHADLRIDIRDAEAVKKAFSTYKPDIVFHLAAQALVRTSYKVPALTYETNLMGSLNILEAVRECDSAQHVIMITSDKCYENVEQIWGYKETDRMGGHDPYSSSKGCVELMISSWRRSFFNPMDFSLHGKCIANVRAGNVIGGGDWSDNRLIPDCIRYIESDQDICIRSPKSTRPWQHVLEPLSGYLLLGEKMHGNPVDFAEAFNFGPSLSSNRTVWEVANKVVSIYGKGRVVDTSTATDLHEDQLLNLDVTKAWTRLTWYPKFSLDESLTHTVHWYKEACHANNMHDFSVQQIEEHYAKAIL